MQPQLFPVTITRTGGIAGFHDLIVVQESGVTTVTGKLGAPRTLVLLPDVLHRLTELLGRLSEPPEPADEPTETTRVSDRMTVEVTTGTSSGPVPLGEGQRPDARLVTDLINDVTSGPPYTLGTETTGDSDRP